MLITITTQITNEQYKHLLVKHIEILVLKKKHAVDMRYSMY
jgi:hypothetical protein